MEEREERMDSLAGEGRYEGASLIQGEANGEGVEVNIILVHAQDHLSMAITASDVAERMVEMYERMARIESGK